MKPISLKSTIPLLVGSLIALPAIASNVDTHQLSYECEHVARNLQNIAESRSQDACSGDVIVAAAYVEAAGLKIKNGKFKLALTSIRYGEEELKAISMSRSYCKNLSSLVKPYLARIITISGQLETLDYLQLERS